MGGIISKAKEKVKRKPLKEIKLRVAPDTVGGHIDSTLLTFPVDDQWETVEKVNNISTLACLLLKPHATKMKLIFSTRPCSEKSEVDCHVLCIRLF